jgi:excisionase family DNA binding protein
MSKILLTVPEVAERLRLSRSKIYILMSRGDIASVNIDRARRIPDEALRDFIARLESAS